MDRLVEFFAGIIQTVWAFTLSNLTLVVGWLVVIVATAVLAPHISQRLRQSSEKRDDHLAELKREVLQPILAYLTDEVIPILEHRLGNVGICEARVPRPGASIMESSIAIREVYCYELVSENVASVLHRLPEESQRPAFFDSPLYRHARQHFRDLFEAWDLLLQEFDDYNAASIRHAEWLRSELARAIPLPEYEDIQQRHWVQTIRLALVVLYRQVGLWAFPPSRMQDHDLQALDYAGARLVTGTPDEVQQCTTALDDLIGRRDQLDRLVARAAPIRARALQLKAKFEDHLQRRRLHGGCEYLP